jgi:hypothetical protein
MSTGAAMKKQQQKHRSSQHVSVEAQKLASQLPMKTIEHRYTLLDNSAFSVPTIMTIGGAVVGTFVGGPIGALIGTAVGGTAGAIQRFVVARRPEEAKKT